MPVQKHFKGKQVDYNIIDTSTYCDYGVARSGGRSQATRSTRKFRGK